MRDLSLVYSTIPAAAQDILCFYYGRSSVNSELDDVEGVRCVCLAYVVSVTQSAQRNQQLMDRWTEHYYHRTKARRPRLRYERISLRTKTDGLVGVDHDMRTNRLLTK
jgi:hypothetical protein